MAMRKRPDNWYGKPKTNSVKDFYGSLSEDEFSIRDEDDPVLDGETRLDETEETEY